MERVSARRCERLIRSALDGPSARFRRLHHYLFSTRPARAHKQPGGLQLAWRGSRQLICHSGPWLYRPLWCVLRLDQHGRLVAADTENRELGDTLVGWGSATGPILQLVELRDLDAPIVARPHEATLGLLDRDGWTAEAAFLLANVAIAAVRKHMAVRKPQTVAGGIERARAASVDQPRVRIVA